MVKISIPILVQDPQTWLESDPGKIQKIKPPLFEGAVFERSSFGNGPSTDIVTIEAGQAVYIPPNKNKKTGGFKGPLGEDLLKEMRSAWASKDPQIIEKLICSPEFIKVSTFACILRTIDLFKPNLLGREWTWSFSAKHKKLICQPCQESQGNSPNGVYIRVSRRISFTQTHQPDNKDLYASLSREVVAHETAHAIMDGINPHLYTSNNKNTQALRESLADLTALFVSIDSRSLMDYVMAQDVGSLDKENAFDKFAENIGKAIYGEKKNALRNFRNDEILPAEIHDSYQASTVLSGAIWDVICQLHAPCRNELAMTRPKYKDKPCPQYSASGEPLATLAARLQPVLYRALDFLPCGNIKMSDYARAVLLVDQILFGPDTEIAKNLTEAFQKRNILPLNEVKKGSAPAEPTPPRGGWKALLKGGKVARNFIDKEREWLKIPDNVPIKKIVIESKPCITAPAGKYIKVKLKKDGSAGSISYQGVSRTEPIGILRIMWDPVDLLEKIRDILNPDGGEEKAGTSLIIDISNDRILGRLSTKDQ